MTIAKTARPDSRIWIKFCGIRTPEDACAAASTGADAIGLNFVAGPRKIGIEQAIAILDALPATVTPIALINAIPEDVMIQRLERTPVEWLQWYGDWSRETVGSLRSRFRLIRVVHVRSGFAAEDLAAIQADEPADALLFDTVSGDGRVGGTGKTFDWHTLARIIAGVHRVSLPPVILAGGLTPQNVADAIATVSPWGVDVAGGVESAPGVKDPSRMAAFVQSVRAASGRA